MSAVGDSKTSKYHTSHIKQATLIPALLRGSGEGTSEEPPILSQLSSPTHPRHGLTRTLPSPCLLMPQQLAKHTGATQHSIAPHITEVSASWEHSWVQWWRQISFLILQEMIKPAHTQTHRKCSVMSKQLVEKDGHLSVLALKFSADKKGILHAKYGM